MSNTDKTYDAFLSYNSKDKKEVKIIAQLFANEGIKTWFDAWNVLAGDPWQEKLENALDDSKAVVVLIGSEGIGPWQNEEIRTAIDEWVTKRSIRVIPVLLPNAVEPDNIPKSLKNLSWAVYKDNIYEDNTLNHIIRSIRGETEPGIPPIIKSPYRGLEVFKEEHQNLFFGREDEVAEIAEHLAQHHFMAVIGVSGSGKSSMVQAGVIPKLRKQEHIKAVLLMKPGEKPVEELATAIFHSLKENEKSNEAAKEDIINLIPLLIENKETLHLKARQLCPKEEDKILLVVDQFEELFLLAEKGEQRDAFIELLLYAFAGKKTQIIITMRSDFIGKVGEFSLLNQTVIQNLIQIGTMDKEKLTDIIVKPALIAGIIFEKGLEQRILFEVKNSSGKLPLIEFTLDQLFENRNGNRFEHAVYEKIGGVTGALSQHAEAQYDKLDKEEKALLRKMFTYFFIYPGEGFEDTKRRVNKTNLLNIDAKAEKVIQTFLNARLLSTTEDKEQGITFVEVAHEALINNWNRIQEWIKDERENNRLYNNLKPEADAYTTTQDKALLYSGLTLTKIEAFYEGNKDIFSEEETQFVEDSVKLRQRNIKRTRWVVASIISILLIALLVSLYFFRNSKEANKETQKQLANNYFQQALREDDGNFKLHKLSLALKASPVNDKFNRRIKSHYTKQDNTQKNIMGFSFTKKEIPLEAILNKNKDQILSWTLGGRLILWNLETGLQMVELPEQDDYIRGAIFNKEENQILSWSMGGRIKLWDLETGQQMVETRRYQLSSYGHHGFVVGAVFSKEEDQILSWGEDGSIGLWDAKTGQLEVDMMEHDTLVVGAAFNKEEDQILSWSKDGSIRLWDAKTGQQKTKAMVHSEMVYATLNKNKDQILSWSADGSIGLWDAKTISQKMKKMQHKNVRRAIFNKNEDLILSWGYDSVKLWDAKTGQLRVKPMIHSNSVSGAMFNKEGDQILSWSSDGSVRLWDAKTGQLKVNPMKHDYISNSGYRGNGAMFNKEGDQILSWGGDYIKLWDAKTGMQKIEPMRHYNLVIGAVFSKNENQILSWSRDGSIKLWDSQINQQKIKLMKHDDFVNKAVFNKNKDQILSWSIDGSIKLWDVKTGELKVEPMIHDESVFGTIFSKEEDQILSWSADGSIGLWDAKTGELKIQKMQHNNISEAIFNKEEDEIMSWGGDYVKLWDTQTGKKKIEQIEHNNISGAIFNKEEDQILSWGFYGDVRLWDAQTGQLKVQPMIHYDPVLGAVFSKNEDLILSWSYDGSIGLWDVQTGRQKVEKMQHNSANPIGSLQGAIFNKNEDQILSWGPDGNVKLWDVQTGQQKVETMIHKGPNRAFLNKNEDQILSWGFGDIKLWDIKTGKQKVEPMQHIDVANSGKSINGTVFNKNEDQILSWGGDYIKLWDSESGVQIGKPMKHDSIVDGALFGKKDQQILSWSSDGYIKLWDVPGDLDLPKDDFLLQTQVTTGTIYNENADTLEIIPPAAWHEKKKAWLKKAKAHAKKCQYPRQNVFINYYATEQELKELELEHLK